MGGSLGRVGLLGLLGLLWVMESIRDKWEGAEGVERVVRQRHHPYLAQEKGKDARVCGSTLDTTVQF